MLKEERNHLGWHTNRRSKLEGRHRKLAAWQGCSIPGRRAELHNCIPRNSWQQRTILLWPRDRTQCKKAGHTVSVAGDMKLSLVLLSSCKIPLLKSYAYCHCYFSRNAFVKCIVKSHGVLWDHNWAEDTVCTITTGQRAMHTHSQNKQNPKWLRRLEGFAIEVTSRETQENWATEKVFSNELLRNSQSMNYSDSQLSSFTNLTSEGVGIRSIWRMYSCSSKLGKVLSSSWIIHSAFCASASIL